MSTQLEQALAPLQAYRDQLVAEVEADSASLKQKTDELKRIEATLKGLGKPPSKPRQAKPKKSAGKADVIAAATGLLADNGELPSDDLKGLTQDKLREQGFDLVGAFRHWERLLAEADNITEPSAGVYGLAVKPVSNVA